MWSQEGALGAVWKALPPLSAAAQKIVVSEPAYFAFHHDRLDDSRYRLAGFPIGSGIIENACKTVIKPRESGTGMRWVDGSGSSRDRNPPCALSFQELASLLAKGTMRSARALFSKDCSLITIVTCTLAGVGDCF